MENQIPATPRVTEPEPLSAIWSLDKETHPFFDRETFEFLDEETIQLLIEDKISTGG